MHRNKGKKNTAGNAFFQREDEYSSVKSINEAILSKKTFLIGLNRYQGLELIPRNHGKGRFPTLLYDLDAIGKFGCHVSLPPVLL